MENDTPIQPDARYEGTDSGRVLTYRQIGYIGAKTSTAVERTDCGFTVDGELFLPITDS